MKQALFHLNWVTVVIATLAYFALGAIWYAKFAFGPYWGRVNNISLTDRKGMVRTMVIGFICTFIITATTGLMLNAVRCKDFSDCFTRSYILISGFVVGLIGLTFIFQKKPIAYIVMEIFYHLIGILIAALILAKWGMT